MVCPEEKEVEVEVTEVVVQCFEIFFFFTKDKFGNRLTEKLCLSQCPVSS